jgi:methionyl-tRNA formyltransferase
LRLVIDKVTALDESTDASPGTVVRSAGEICVATGKGILRIDRLQPAGKKVMAAAEFLRGYPIAVGTNLRQMKGS